LDCPSCGATGQTKARCEACGFAFAQASSDVADDALSLFLGLVCTSCDAYNEPGVTSCTTCGAALIEEAEASQPFAAAPVAPVAVVAPPPPPPLTPTPSSATLAPPSWMTPPTGQPLATAFAMKKVDLAVMTEAPPVALAAPKPTPLPTKAPLPPATSTPAATPAAPPTASALCWRCQAPLEKGDKFCRACGARADQAPAPATPLAPTSTVSAVGAAATNLSAATQVMAALKLPTAPAPPPASSSSTMVLPAMHAAQSQPAPAPASAHGSSTATMVFGAVTVERAAKLILVRGNNQFGNQWRMQAQETVIGRSQGSVLFPDDQSIAPRHARLTWRGPSLMLEPELTTNGVYIRIRGPVRLQPGDEFLVGAQRLRVLADEDRPLRMQSEPETRLLGSAVKAQPPIALARVTADPVTAEVYFRPQRLLTIGRAHCDIMFPNDGFVSERHVQLTNEVSGVLTLEDLGSRNGTYVRCRTATALVHGDLLLLGDQVLRVELPKG